MCGCTACEAKDRLFNMRLDVIEKVMIDKGIITTEEFTALFRERIVQETEKVARNFDLTLPSFSVEGVNV